VEILFRLLQAHLETFRTEHPIVAAGLEAQPARAVRQQFHLFETPLRDPSRLHETLTRLTGLLGWERVGRPVREDSHRPDAFRIEPFAWKLPDSSNEFWNETMIGPALRRMRAGFLPGPKGAVVAWQGPYLASGIGGMKRNGSGRNGIWHSRTALSGAVKSEERNGGWMQFTTEKSRTITSPSVQRASLCPYSCSCS
jgi:hypothetical protein